MDPNPTSLDDALAARSASGDHRALSQLLERSPPGVLRIAFAITGQDEDAQDAAQQTLLHLIRALNERKVVRPFRAWLPTLTHSTTVNVLRRRVNLASRLEAPLPEWDGVHYMHRK